jgi:hypothetical protein
MPLRGGIKPAGIEVCDAGVDDLPAADRAVWATDSVAVRPAARAPASLRRARDRVTAHAPVRDATDDRQPAQQRERARTAHI